MLLAQVHFDPNVRLGDLLLLGGIFMTGVLWVHRTEGAIRKLRKSDARTQRRLNLIFRWWVQNVIGDEGYLAEYRLIEQQELEEDLNGQSGGFSTVGHRHRERDGDL